MIYNYTRCESVIAKIMADLDMSEKNIKITDIKEWIFEAVDKIGAPTQYEQVESGVGREPILKIHNRQVPIPRGLQSLDAVAYSTSPNGPWYPMRKDTGSFHNLFNNRPKHQHVPKDPEDNNCPNHPEDCQCPACAIKYTVPCVHEEEHDGFIEHPVTSNAQLYTKNGMKYFDTMFPKGFPFNDCTYFIKPGWIVSNMPKGYIKLSYKRTLVDEKGYPVIPDLASYQEAVYWYVVMKLSFPKYLKGKLGGKRGVNTSANTYQYIQQQWHFYRNQAYVECMMPDAGEMRAIKNDWTKLIPDWDSDDTFFRHAGDRQTIINDYYYGY